MNLHIYAIKFYDKPNKKEIMKIFTPLELEQILYEINETIDNSTEYIIPEFFHMKFKDQKKYIEKFNLNQNRYYFSNNFPNSKVGNSFNDEQFYLYKNNRITNLIDINFYNDKNIQREINYCKDIKNQKYDNDYIQQLVYYYENHEEEEAYKRRGCIDYYDNLDTIITPIDPLIPLLERYINGDLENEIIAIYFNKTIVRDNRRKVFAFGFRTKIIFKKYINPIKSKTYEYLLEFFDKTPLNLIIN